MRILQDRTQQDIPSAQVEHTPSQTIERAAYTPSSSVQHIRVDHRGAHILVSQKLLDDADVIALFEQVRGK